MSVRAARPRCGRRFTALGSLLVLALALSPSLSRAESVASLGALKAAYAFHFLNLIRWERADPWLDFCVFADSDTGDRMLGALQKKTAHGQSIRARRLPRDMTQPEHCDALYIPEAYASYLPTLLKRYENSATVTISDAAGFAAGGGIIEFVIVDERLRFDVNERVAGKRRLKISAKLLELARNVIR